MSSITVNRSPKNEQLWESRGILGLIPGRLGFDVCPGMSPGRQSSIGKRPGSRVHDHRFRDADASSLYVNDV